MARADGIGYSTQAPHELAQSGGFYDVTVYPKYKKDEVDTNRLAVNLKDTQGDRIVTTFVLDFKTNTRIIDVATSDFNPVTAADDSDIA